MEDQPGMEPAVRGPHRVLFLDRDGVINEKAAAGHYITSWDEFRFCQGIAQLLIVAEQHQLKRVVITNQQCVGKGLLERRALEELHRQMTAALESAGAGIDGIYYCPHLESERCDCRKPRPGLLYQAVRELGGDVDLANSFFVGDTESDMAAGRAAGVRTIFIGDSGGLRDASVADYIVGSLQEVEPLL